MGYTVELRDISTGRELDMLGLFAQLSDAIECATVRARRFPPNSLVRFDFYSADGHVFSASVTALLERGRRWMS